MFSLFTRIPKKYVEQLSKMRTELTTVQSGNMDNGDILADDFEDEGRNGSKT